MGGHSGGRNGGAGGRARTGATPSTRRQAAGSLVIDGPQFGWKVQVPEAGRKPLLTMATQLKTKYIKFISLQIELLLVTRGINNLLSRLKKFFLIKNFFFFNFLVTPVKDVSVANISAELMWVDCDRYNFSNLQFHQLEFC